MLITSGCKINEKDKYGRTPLFIATLKGRNEIIKLLLENDADIYSSNNENKTPYDIAKTNKQIFSIFLKKIVKKKFYFFIFLYFFLFFFIFFYFFRDKLS